MVDFAIFTVYYIQTFPKINYYDDSWNNNNNLLTTEIYITMYIHIIQVDIMTGEKFMSILVVNMELIYRSVHP